MIINDRRTGRIEGEFVVFLIGMRINRWWKFWQWLRVGASMPKMIRELEENPDLGFLGAEMWFGRTTIMVQYWRSTEQLLAYAKNRKATHLPAWKAFNETVGTNGDVGISQIPLPEWPGGSKLTGLAYDLVLAGLAVLGVIILDLIVHSTFGRRLIAIREDDGLAETLGIDVTRQKLVAFFIASLFASVGGALYAPYVGFISPRSFDVLVSLNIWLMVAFGGRGTIWGPVIGAVLLAPVPFLLQDYYTIKDVVYGLLIIGVIVLLPAGIAGGFKRAPKNAPKKADPALALKPERAK